VDAVWAKAVGRDMHKSHMHKIRAASVNDLFIGWCGLKYDPAANEYDLGYRFIQNYWGKGYATEAARGVLEYCREHLTGKRIVGKALIENVASIRVLEKIGMQFERNEEDSDGTVAVYSLNVER